MRKINFNGNNFLTSTGNALEKFATTFISQFNFKNAKPKNIKDLAEKFQFNFMIKLEEISEIIKLLKLQDEEGCTIGMYFARLQSQEKVKAYISFLVRIYRVGAASKELIEIFKIQDKKGWTFGMDVAQLCEKQTVMNYLELLELLQFENKIEENIFALSQLEGKVTLHNKVIRWSFAEVVAYCQDVAVLYHLIASGLLPEREYHKLAEKKTAIANYIFSMSNHFFKKNALRDALDCKHPLGKLFLLTQELRCLPSSILKQRMRDELTKLHNADIERWRAAFFPFDKDRILADDDLDLRTPYELMIP